MVGNFSLKEEDELLRLRRLREEETVDFMGKDSRKPNYWVRRWGEARLRFLGFMYVCLAISSVNAFLSGSCIFIFVLIDQ